MLRRSWGEEVVVFNTGSGQTHLLDALSAAMLEEIERDPAALDDLTRRLAAQFDIDEDTLTERLSTVLRRFDDLGLIEPDRR